MATSDRVKALLEKEEMDDLERFLSRKRCLNAANTSMIYLFHIVQSMGILTTTVAAGYERKDLIWVGAGLNILATLIHVFEKTNESISKQLSKDIEEIKNGTYDGEDLVIDGQTNENK
jgi:hypothetical protein